MATNTENSGPRTLGKVRPHQTQNEALVFEKSSPGKRAYKMPPLDVPAVDAAALLGAAHRDTPGLLPELSEIEIIRHFTRLSTWNYAIDLGMYPLGSCTMKYNPRVNEAVARIEGLAEAHPYRPDSLAQGVLEIIELLQRCLIEITGMDAITLQPAAGAHGELTGIMLVRAWHESQGNARRKVLIPDSAHGTNPATAAISGYTVENLKSNAEGGIDLEALAAQVDEETTALMLTNPSTIGVFESQIHKIADILHAKGALLYMDGANMNALVGKTRPGDFGVDVMHLNLHKTFSTPHGGGDLDQGRWPARRFWSRFYQFPSLREGRELTDQGLGTQGLREQELPANCAGITIGHGPLGACERSMETLECLFARWLTFWQTDQMACGRPQKTPCSTPTTFAPSLKTSTSCPTRRPQCTKWSSVISGRQPGE